MRDCAVSTRRCREPCRMVVCSCGDWWFFRPPFPVLFQHCRCGNELQAYKIKKHELVKAISHLLIQRLSFPILPSPVYSSNLMMIHSEQPNNIICICDRACFHGHSYWMNVMLLYRIIVFNRTATSLETRTKNSKFLCPAKTSMALISCVYKLCSLWSSMWE